MMVTTDTRTDDPELQALRAARTQILNHHQPAIPHPGYYGAGDDHGYTWQTNLSAYIAHPDLLATSPVFCNACDEPSWEDTGRTFIDGLGRIVHRERRLNITASGVYPCDYAYLLLATIPEEPQP